jgi:hypothetical protein
MLRRNIHHTDSLLWYLQSERASYSCPSTTMLDKHEVTSSLLAQDLAHPLQKEWQVLFLWMRRKANDYAFTFQERTCLFQILREGILRWSQDFPAALTAKTRLTARERFFNILYLESTYP